MKELQEKVDDTCMMLAQMAEREKLFLADMQRLIEELQDNTNKTRDNIKQINEFIFGKQIEER